MEIFYYEVNEVSRDDLRFASYSDEDLAEMINDMEADTKYLEDTLHVKFLIFGGAAKVECIRAFRYQNTARIDIYESEYLEKLTVREFHIKVESGFPLGEINFKDKSDKDEILPTLDHWE